MNIQVRKEMFHWPGVVSATLVFGCGGFGDVDGLLQRPLQMHSALLNHFTDVLYPVLFVLNTGRLCLCVWRKKTQRNTKC